MCRYLHVPLQGLVQHTAVDRGAEGVAADDDIIHRESFLVGCRWEMEADMSFIHSAHSLFNIFLPPLLTSDDDDSDGLG